MTPTATYRPSDAARVTFIAVCCMWMIMPLLLSGTLAQDAVPYVVAGEFVEQDASLVYASVEGDLFDLKAPVARRTCDLMPVGTDCSSFAVAYVSTPLALPFSWAVAQLGADAGVLAMRLAAAACLVAGMATLWRRLSPRRRDAGAYLAAVAVLLTPFVMVPLGLGQTSPVLFLAAALGVRGTRRNARAAGVGAVVASAIAFKLFPAGVLAVALWQRRWRLLAWTALWLALVLGLTLALVPGSIFSSFVDATRAISDNAVGNPYNGSISNVVHTVVPAYDGSGLGSVVFGAVLLAAAVAVWVVWARRAGADTQWAFALLLLLVVNPLVWWHYALVGVAAVTIAVIESPTVRRRDLQVLVALAVATVPISIPNARGFSVPVAQAIWMVVAVAVTAWFARRQQPVASTPHLSVSSVE